MDKKTGAIILINTFSGLWVVAWWWVSPFPLIQASVPAWILTVFLLCAMSTNLILGYKIDFTIKQTR